MLSKLARIERSEPQRVPEIKSKQEHPGLYAIKGQSITSETLQEWTRQLVVVRRAPCVSESPEPLAVKQAYWKEERERLIAYIFFGVHLQESRISLDYYLRLCIIENWDMDIVSRVFSELNSSPCLSKVDYSTLLMAIKYHTEDESILNLADVYLNKLPKEVQLISEIGLEQLITRLEEEIRQENPPMGCTIC